MTPRKEPPIASADALYALCEALVRGLARVGKSVATAESCTGGLLSKLLTDVPGSSAVLKGGVVAYQNEIKIGVLGVPKEIIDQKTEVSAACAEAMANGAARLFGTDYALSTTGYAGPGGGTDEHPVGTVYLGLHTKGHTSSICIDCPGCSRAEVCQKAAEVIFSMLLLEIEKE